MNVITSPAYAFQPGRATATPPEAQPAPAPPPAPSYDARAAAAFAAPQVTGMQGRNRGDEVLGEIAEKSTDPVEKAVAATLRQAAAVQCFRETAMNAQQKTLEALAAGVKGPVGQTLASLGKEAMNGAKQPDEARRMGLAVLGGIASCSQNPAEVVFAKAASSAAALKIFDDTGANLIKGAFDQIQQGIADPARAVGQLGLTLGQATAQSGDVALGEQCNLGNALFTSLAQSTQNKTAKALSEMSSRHKMATDGLLKAQQEAFANLAAGQESQYAHSPGETQYLTSNKDALTCALGGLAIQGGMMALGGVGGGLGWVAGLLVGALAFGTVKGVYHGLMEVNARKTGPMRYDQAYVDRAFSAGFKAGLKGNLLRSLIHTSINGAAYTYLGAPTSLVVGPAVSAALAKFTGL